MDSKWFIRCLVIPAEVLSVNYTDRNRLDVGHTFTFMSRRTGAVVARKISFFWTLLGGEKTCETNNFSGGYRSSRIFSGLAVFR